MDNALKMEKQRLREEKQLNRLLKEKHRPKHKMYIWYLLLVLTLIYIIDEIISNLQSNLISEMSQSIFPDIFSSQGPVEARRPFDLVALIAIAILAFSMFYKPLADKFGRKPFLVINTFGMGAAVAICSLGELSSSLGTLSLLARSCPRNFFPSFMSFCLTNSSK